MGIELTLRAEVDDANAAAELFVQFNADEFSGRSSAWFKLEQLRQFADEIAHYPLAKGSRPNLIGGIWDVTGNRIAQEHICISVEPSGNLGKLSLCVRLATPDDGQDISKRKYSASANIMTEYARLSEIANDLAALASGTKKEVRFTFEASAG